jgi:hypothetical protein
MAHHYTKNTESDTKWCNVCMNLTQHKVSDGRIGRCMEHEQPAESARQKKEREKRDSEALNPRLF